MSAPERSVRPVTVLYFARLREALGRSRDDLLVPAEVATVGQLRQWLLAQGAPWAEAFGTIRHIRAAVGQQMAVDETPLLEAAEVAFFPPVTGG
jgi:molybdopterin synthase sulfur carrier subunit